MTDISISNFITKIHFIRHAQTADNIYKKVSGNGSDPSITELGIQQANSRGIELIPFRENISYIVTSNMTRTNQTAAEINKYLNLRVYIDPNMQEQYFGKLEGENSEILKAIESSENPNALATEYGGESHEDFKQRIKVSLCEHFQSGESEILIVSHGRVCRIAKEIFHNIPNYYCENVQHIIFDPIEIVGLSRICGLVISDEL